MKLLVENICKIAQADIRLDGLTIITGNNNTGKSTIGKALWTMFDAFTSIQNKTRTMRLAGCLRILKRDLPFAFNSKSRKAICRKLISHELTIPEALDALTEDPETNHPPDWDPYTQKQLEELLAIDDDTLQRQIVRDSFTSAFSGQFTSLMDSAGIPSVTMTIQGRRVSVRFDEHDRPTIKSELALKNRAFLLNSPELLEQEPHDYINITQRRSISRSFQEDSTEEQSAPDNSITEKQFDPIQTSILDTIGGSIVYDDMYGFRFADANLPDRLDLANLSQGIKAMGILQAAFCHGAIQEGDVLILDEPEIHLHPTWQLKYAELIVLLQKTYQLTVLLTTHSPDFVQAIRLYAQRHQTADTLAAYLAETNDRGIATLRPISHDNWDEVFAQFAIGFDRLMEITQVR